MIAYKLLRKRKDGSLGPLFFDRKRRIPIGTWEAATDHLVQKGYAYRPGWHTTKEPEAPHLSLKGRVWCEVEICDWYVFTRPLNQGGEWLIARRMKIVRELV